MRIIKEDAIRLKASLSRQIVLTIENVVEATSSHRATTISEKLSGASEIDILDLSVEMGEQIREYIASAPKAALAGTQQRQQKSNPLPLPTPQMAFDRAIETIGLGSKIGITVVWNGEIDSRVSQ